MLSESRFRRGVLDDDRHPAPPLNWYELFTASGLDLDDTKGDGVGRFTLQDKTNILDGLYARANALEAGERVDGSTGSAG